MQKHLWNFYRARGVPSMLVQYGSALSSFWPRLIVIKSPSTKSTTICHNAPSLKSDMAGVRHGHFNVQYVVVFSHVFSIYLTGIWLHFLPETMILTTSPAFISLSTDLCLTLTSGWDLPHIGWTLHWGRTSYLLNSLNAHCPFWGKLATAPTSRL